MLRKIYISSVKLKFTEPSFSWPISRDN